MKVRKELSHISPLYQSYIETGSYACAKNDALQKMPNCLYRKIFISHIHYTPPLQMKSLPGAKVTVSGRQERSLPCAYFNSSKRGFACWFWYKGYKNKTTQGIIRYFENYTSKDVLKTKLLFESCTNNRSFCFPVQYFISHNKSSL